MLILVLVRCAPDQQELTTQNVPLVVAQGDVTLRATPPQGWRGFLDDTYLILTSQQTDSIVVNVWMPDEELIADAPVESSTRTAEVLREITNTPQLIGNAIASTPEPFQWMDYDGAYYVLNSGTEAATLVIALTPRQSSQMIVINITAPEHTLNNLPSEAGAALENIHINEQPLGADLLSLLPQPLEVPDPDPAAPQMP